MKKISKTALITTFVVGATLLSSTSASAFEGGMRGEMREKGGEDQFRLISEDMRTELKEKHMLEFENLSEEERTALREERREAGKVNREAHQQEVANFAGVSRDELKEAHQNGTNIGDLLTQNGKTQEDASTFLTEHANERVNNISERHQLDSEQEATVRERVTQFVTNMLGRWFQ